MKKKEKLNAGVLSKRYLNGERLFKYEEDYLRKFLIRKADDLFSKFIRNRDKYKDCISYWATGCQNKIQNACHWIGRWYYSHRRDEDNVYWWCVSCNAYHQQEHWAFFERFQTKKHWQKWVDEQYFMRNKRKPKLNQLFEIINKYKKK